MEDVHLEVWCATSWNAASRTCGLRLESGNLFMTGGGIEVRERRTKVDWAHVVKRLVDEDYADRERIVLVMDNLNTHKLSSLYEAFEPSEARRIAERLEIHYTPKHGSWLNMAEIEIGVLTVPGASHTGQGDPWRGRSVAEEPQS